MKNFLIAFFILFTVTTVAQNACPPFWNDIVQFKKEDAAAMPAKNAILFVGSSSFTKWTDVASYFPGYSIINRGFGGSTLPDVIRYTYDVILPYQPKQVVIYCGENDLASGDSITANDVVQRFKTLFGIIRQNLPQANIQFVSLKPSPSRQTLFPKMEAANAAIKTFLKSEKNAGFIDVYHAMLDAKGNPRQELFLEDNLHMKPSGYAIWQKIIQPHLLK
jgi:lysophospholipase L1-like esterase